jgi:hypothetical protein
MNSPGIRPSLEDRVKVIGIRGQSIASWYSVELSYSQTIEDQVTVLEKNSQEKLCRRKENVNKVELGIDKAYSEGNKAVDLISRAQ